MAIGKFLETLVNNGRTLKWIILAIMGLLVIGDILVPSSYDRFFWEQIGGFGAVYGFISCVLIIVVSKALGYALLYRKEDYYDHELEGHEMSGDPRDDKEQGNE
ncbi:hypothetical protein [Natronospira bacteriovora]|uniref:Uncharacterized protein n=1 Tax=Natronospira bacteriovora TaxID=3069753 RepID=A0ABU0W4M0_9GAMM|nr:hypothetical protein [Natronospira sp. AB-CW4]MDQ2068959.1 hypothetical protein [Natronospira sp. AB-CW4]